MPFTQVFEQSIEINAPVAIVERCIIDNTLMKEWLNPALSCVPVGEWSTDVGAESRFIINIPLWQPALNSVVIKREPGLIVWGFQGFFQGSDCWQCSPFNGGTLLVNRFEFLIPNPVVAFGFNLLAAGLTKRDMEAQLGRLKALAEKQNNCQQL